jgi:hypothetical protein
MSNPSAIPHLLGVCRNPIPSHLADLVSHLDKICGDRFLDSKVWLTAHQASSFFGTKIFQRCEDRPELYAAKLDLASLQLDPAITPAAQFFDDKRRRFFFSSNPIPDHFPLKTMLLYRGSATGGSAFMPKAPAKPASGQTSTEPSSWEPLPAEYATFASFAFKAKYDSERPTFVRQRFETFLKDTPTVDLYNAQSFMNAFAIDKQLFHVNCNGMLPFPPQLGSGLTTVRAQHQFESVRWVHEDEVDSLGFKPKQNATPNCAVDVIRTGFYNVSDFPVRLQRYLGQKIPAWVKRKERPMCRIAGVWRTLEGAPKRSPSTVQVTPQESVPTSQEDPSQQATKSTEAGVLNAHFIWFSATDFESLFPDVTPPARDLTFEKSVPFPDRFYNREQLILK